MPHQAEGLAYALKRKKLALFWEMRCGKSMVALRWAQEEAQSGRVLIVAPLTVLPAWEAELLKEGHSPDSFHYLTGSKKSKFLENSHKRKTGWFLVNYEAARACTELLKMPWKAVILDESTKIRNPQAQVTKVFLNQTSHIPRKAILSGLPAPETPLDYFCQLNFIFGPVLGCSTFWEFRNRFFQTDFTGWDWRPRFGSVQKIKEFVHANCSVLTRKDIKVGSPKIYEKRYVEMLPLQKEMYKAVEKDFSYGASLEQATKWATVKFVWLARIAGGFSPEGKLLSNAKAFEIVNLLTGEMKTSKVVIWFRFNDELQHVLEYLRGTGIKVCRVAGEDPLEVRQAATAALNQGSIQAICAQVKCGKYGLDWSAADAAIYYSNTYDMEDRAQSEDRIVHPQKTEPNLVVDLITRNTLDEDVVQILQEKYVNARLFMTKLVKTWTNKLERNGKT